MTDLIIINARSPRWTPATRWPKRWPSATARSLWPVPKAKPAPPPPGTIIDAGGRRLIPGLIDSHIHVIRGGLNYNMELRWEGVPSLADAMAMLKLQAQNTPHRNGCAWWAAFTEHQFAEKRLPTIEEINAAAPDTPVFILHLYDRALLNAAALRAVGYTKDTPNPPGGEIVRDAQGNPTGLLAQPNATILYATLAKGPKLPQEYQLNSTRQFMRELNSLGVTSVIDAGGGSQNYPTITRSSKSCTRTAR
jgi:predicted amidohydrolase YtcJ